MHHLVPNSLAALVLWVALATLLMIGHDRYGLFDVDEAIFAETSLEMLENADYIKPTYNGEPRYHKPPLIYWAQAASLQTFNLQPWAARVPSMLFAFATLLVMAWGVWKLSGSWRWGQLTAGIMGINVLFVVVGRAAIADSALNFFITASTLCLLVALYAEHKKPFYMLLGGALLGFGLLTKGPIALLVPTAVVGTAIIMRPGTLATNLRFVNPLYVIGACLAVVLPWLVAITNAVGLDFFYEFLWVHNIERFSGGFSNTQGNGFLFYPLVLLFGFFPWVVFLPAAIASVLPNFYKRLKSEQAADALPALALIWAVAVIGVFMFSSTQLAHYIGGAWGGLAILVAWKLRRLIDNPLGSLTDFFGMLLIFVFVIFFSLLPFVPQTVLGTGPVASILANFNIIIPPADELTRAVLATEISMGATPFIIAAILFFGVGGALQFVRRGYIDGVILMGASMSAVLILLLVSIVPVVYGYTQKPLFELAIKLKDLHESGDDVLHIGLHKPSVRLVSGLPFTPISAPAQLGSHSWQPRTFMLLEQNRLPEVRSFLPKQADETADCRGGYCLLSVQLRRSVALQ